MPLNSTTMRSHGHCTADRMMGSSSTAYHRRRHRKYSKKHMMAFVELISLARSLGIDSIDWGITSPRWSPTPSLMPNDVMPVKSMVTLSIKHQDIFALQLQLGHLRCEEWMWLALPSSQGHRFILAITDYFSKWAKVIPLREVKASDMIKFVKITSFIALVCLTDRSW